MGRSEGACANASRRFAVMGWTGRERQTSLVESDGLVWYYAEIEALHFVTINRQPSASKPGHCLLVISVCQRQIARPFRDSSYSLQGDLIVRGVRLLSR